MRAGMCTAMLLLLACGLTARSQEAAAPPPTLPAEPPLERLRLKAGAVLAGRVVRFENDTIVMKVFGVERAYRIDAIEELKTTSTDPQFLRAVTASALKAGNGLLAFVVGARDPALARGVLTYPKFAETVAECERADELADRIVQAQGQARAQRERLLRQIDALDKAIAESQDVLANPYYYETVSVTRRVVCGDCNGSGWVRDLSESDRVVTDKTPLDKDGADHVRRPRARRCPTCLGLGTLTSSGSEQVRRMRDVNAESARLLARRAERDRADKVVDKLDQELAGSDPDLKAARDALADAGARLKRLCAEMWETYFADPPAAR